MSVLVVVLTIGLMARITRLLTVDRISFKARAWIVVKLGPKHPISYFVTCPWCVGVWVAAAVSVAGYFWADQRWWLFAGLAATGSYVTGLLAQYTLDDSAEA